MDTPSSSSSSENEFEDEVKPMLRVDKTFDGDLLTKTVEENVCVAVRVRPLCSKEIDKGFKDVLFVNQVENLITLSHPSSKHEQKNFKFDAVFPSTTVQAELYNQIARPIVQNVIQGYNGTIFAYGQTGTGKTYTMEGDRSVPELKGIIPNSFAQIFSHIANETGNSKFLVRVSYLEIYNEEVRDLIGKESIKKLEIKEGEGGVYVKGLSSFVVKNEKDMERILGVGKKNRVVGETKMNLESSRSHAIFTVTVECSTENETKHSLRMGKLNLVDLAGSERAGKSGATGLRLKEGAKINLSLSCLGNVISALVDGKPFIPYRSSKLTRLLQDSLGGNSKTVMIANIGPADYNYEETLSTLRYSDRAKSIKNHAHINEDPKDAILRQFETEIEALKKQLEEEDLKLRNIIGKTNDEVIDEEVSDEEKPEIGFLPDSETLTGIKGELATQEILSTTVKAEVQHKQCTLFALKENVLTWKQHQEKKATLQEKLVSIQKKIMIGGESLVDKSQEQEEYLQRCMKELNEHREEQYKLRDSLSTKIAEKVVSEERALQLQFEHKKIKNKIRKAMQVLQAEELADEIILEEERTEREALEKEINRVTQEIGKSRCIIDNYIPNEALMMIESNMIFNHDTSGWSLQYKDFSGNHLKQSYPYCQGPRNYTAQKDLSFAYKSIDLADLQRNRRNNEDMDPLSQKNKDYMSIEPVRTNKFVSTAESLKMLQKYDILEPPTFHFLNFEESDQELFSARSRHSRKH